MIANLNDTIQRLIWGKWLTKAVAIDSLGDSLDGAISGVIVNRTLADLLDYTERKAE